MLTNLSHLTLEPDRNQLEAFIEPLLRHRGKKGYLSLRSFLADNKVLPPIVTVDLAYDSLKRIVDLSMQQARLAARAPTPAVFCPPLAVFDSLTKWQARESDLLVGLVISVECDEHPDEAAAKLQDILGPATVIVKSGGQWINGDGEPQDRVHLHWRLRTPARADDLKKLKQARAAATAIAGGDASNIPTVHCLRWPGSWHRKGTPRLCTIAQRNPDHEIDLDEALALLLAAAPPTQSHASGAANGGDRSDWGELISNILAGKNLHLSTLKLTAKKLAAGMSPGAVVNEVRQLMNSSAARAERPEEWHQRFADIPRLVDDWLKDHRQPPPPGVPPPGAVPPRVEPRRELPLNVTIDDFHAYMPQHKYICAPTREIWVAAGVDGRLPRIGDIKATTWLDRKKPVEQLTWAPGEPVLIKNRIVSEGGFCEQRGYTCFNLYKPPMIIGGDRDQAGRWIEHTHLIFPDEADHIICWFAQRVQTPQIKINHALVLGGAMGIGKDTMIEPVKRAVGSWNCQEVTPQQIMGRFNGHVKSVILRISEARDLGEVNRYQFYDHMKAIIAAPPDVIRVDEKNLREYSVPNCTGSIITTNHKADGIYLPADDRRHFVAWSLLRREDFEDRYWEELWWWINHGGALHVAAYLKSLDLSGFNPKAPPPKTKAFWEIVDASRAPQDAQLRDLIEEMGNPKALTVASLKLKATGDLAIWFNDPKNYRQIPHRLENCGYVQVANDAAKDRYWVVGGKRQPVYAQDSLTLHEQMEAASEL